MTTVRPGPEVLGTLNALLGWTLTALVSGGIVIRGRNVFASSRFQLLPFPPALMLGLRVTLSTPLVAIGGLIAWALFGATFVGWAARTGAAAAAHLVQLTALILAAVVVTDMLIHQVGRRLPNLVFWGAFMVLALALPQVLDLSAGAPGSTTPGKGRLLTNLWGYLSFRPDDPAGTEFLLTGVLVVVSAGLTALDVRLNQGPRGRDQRLSHRLFLFPTALRRILPVPLRKELAWALRPYLSRNALVASLVVAFPAVIFDLPFLLLYAFVFWALLAQNWFGFDLPLSGTTRYRLLPIDMGDVLRARETAVALVTLGPVGLLLLLASPWIDPTMWLAHLAWLGLGFATFLLASAAGRHMGARFPRALPRTAVFLHGGMVRLPGYFSAGGVVVVVMALVAVAYALLAALFGRSNWTVVAAIAVAVAVNLGVHRLATGRAPRGSMGGAHYLPAHGLERR